MRIKNLILAAATFLTITVAPLFVLSGNAAAVNIFGHSCTTADKNSSVCADVKTQGSSGTNPVIRIIKAAISIVALLVGVAAVIVLIVGGVRMVTASGDPQAVAGARSGIIYALVGLVIAALAQAIVAFALNKIG